MSFLKHMPINDICDTESSMVIVDKITLRLVAEKNWGRLIQCFDGSVISSLVFVLPKCARVDNLEIDKMRVVRRFITKLLASGTSWYVVIR